MISLSIGGFDVFPKEAQQKVIDHYEELGFFYDTAYQVERAWAEYNELGCPKDFRAYVALPVHRHQLLQ